MFWARSTANNHLAEEVVDRTAEEEEVVVGGIREGS
jgi:hypothetical protein